MLKKLISFGALYAVVGVEVAIASVVVPIYLAKAGFPAFAASLLISLITIPWITKFLWGTIVDAYSNIGYKFFIVLGGMLATISNTLILFDHSIFAIVATTFLALLGISLLGVSTDALSITISTKDERGKISGAKFFGQVMGFIFGAIYFTNMTNISEPFIVSNLIFIPLVSLVFLLKENKVVPKEVKLRSLITKSNIKLSVAILLIGLPLGILSISAYYMKSYLQFNSALIGYIMVVSSVASAIGSIIGGILSDKYSRNKVVGFSLLGFGISIAPAYLSFTIPYIIASFFSGAMLSALCTICMDQTKKEIAGTEYSIFTSIANMSGTMGTPIGGLLLGLYGSNVFVIVALLSIISIASLKFISSRPPQPLPFE